jgi:hypothetical protein
MQEEDDMQLVSLCVDVYDTDELSPGILPVFLGPTYGGPDVDVSWGIAGSSYVRWICMFGSMLDKTDDEIPQRMKRWWPPSEIDDPCWNHFGQCEEVHAQLAEWWPRGWFERLMIVCLRKKKDTIIKQYADNVWIPECIKRCKTFQRWKRIQDCTRATFDGKD